MFLLPKCKLRVKTGSVHSVGWCLHNYAYRAVDCPGSQLDVPRAGSHFYYLFAFVLGQ